MLCVGPFHVAVDRSHPDYLHTQGLQRLRGIAPFFDSATIGRVVVPFLEAEADLSLRHLSHLINHMAPRDAIAWHTDNTTVRLYDSYRTWLRIWKRRLFDPFRRNERVYFLQAYQWYSTTVAQLNFFFFAETHGVLMYARKHRATIDADMRAWNEKRREANRRGTKLETPPFANAVQLYDNSRVLQFDH